MIDEYNELSELFVIAEEMAFLEPWLKQSDGPLADRYKRLTERSKELVKELYE